MTTPPRNAPIGDPEHEDECPIPEPLEVPIPEPVREPETVPA